MNIDKYINWQKLWDDEIDIQISIDLLDEADGNAKIVGILEQFKEDTNLELITDECFMSEEGGHLIFTFGESGGQNESDTQGWSRHYSITINDDFDIIDADYEQG